MKINKRARNTAVGLGLAATAVFGTVKTVQAVQAGNAASTQAEKSFAYSPFDEGARTQLEDRTTKACEDETGRGADDPPDDQSAQNVYNNYDNPRDVPVDSLLSMSHTCRDVGAIAGIDMYTHYEWARDDAKRTVSDAAWSKAFWNTFGFGSK